MTHERLVEIVKLLNVRLVHGGYQLIGDSTRCLACMNEPGFADEFAMEIVDSPIGIEGFKIFKELADAGFISDFTSTSASKQETP